MQTLMCVLSRLPCCWLLQSVISPSLPSLGLLIRCLKYSDHDPENKYFSTGSGKKTIIFFLFLPAHTVIHCPVIPLGFVCRLSCHPAHLQQEISQPLYQFLLSASCAEAAAFVNLVFLASHLRFRHLVFTSCHYPDCPALVEMNYLGLSAFLPQCV